MKTHHDRFRVLRRGIFAALLSSLVLSPIRVGWAQPTKAGAIDVSGHFDIQAVEGNVSVANNNFQLGQLGLDIRSDLGSRVSATMEVAYAPEEKNVAVSQAYVDWSTVRRDAALRDDPIGIKRSGFIVGQFDVPFGIDWRSYRPIDRKLVSLPLAVINTHRGWNDMGIQYYGGTNWGNWAVFAVNGFGTSPALRIPASTGSTPLAAGVAAEATNNSLLPTEAFGARFGVLMSEHVEFGTSFGAGYTSKHDQQSRLFGFDATVNYDALELTGEFISHRLDQAAGRENTLGYYLEGSYSVGRPFGVVRIDAFKPDLKPTLFQASAGAGYAVNKYAQLRAEYQVVEGKSNDVLYLQSVVAF
jgi:hypothetical protein